MCAKRSDCSVKTGIFTKVMVASIVHTRYYRYRCLIYVRLRANLSQTESEKKKVDLSWAMKITNKCADIFSNRYRLTASETTTTTPTSSDNRRTRRSTSTAQYRSMIMGLGLIRFLFGFTLQLFIFFSSLPRAYSSLESVNGWLDGIDRCSCID